MVATDAEILAWCAEHQVKHYQVKRLLLSAHLLLGGPGRAGRCHAAAVPDELADDRDQARLR